MQKPWETNGVIRRILTLNWVDIDVLLVNTVKNTVFIKGDLRFKGRLIQDDDEPAVIEKLEKIEGMIMDVDGIEHLRWELKDWRVEEGKWKTAQNTRD